MIDIEELEKLPNNVKVDLIDQLLHSTIDKEEEWEADEKDADPEIIKKMVRRLEDMKTGKDSGLHLGASKSNLATEYKKSKCSQ